MFVIKTTRIADGLKVFVNVCHHTELPAGALIVTPDSPRAELDKDGSACSAYVVVLSSISCPHESEDEHYRDEVNILIRAVDIHTMFFTYMHAQLFYVSFVLQLCSMILDQLNSRHRGNLHTSYKVPKVKRNFKGTEVPEVTFTYDKVFQISGDDENSSDFKIDSGSGDNLTSEVDEASMSMEKQYQTTPVVHEILPEASFVMKLVRVGDNCKVFINVCHHADIAPGDLLVSPQSPCDVSDKGGDPCVAYTVAVSSQSLEGGLAGAADQATARNMVWSA